MLGAVDSRPVIEVLFFEGCPHYQLLLSRLRQLLHTSHIDAELIEREVITDQMAVEHRFLGSPTVRINSVDIDPNLSDRDEYGPELPLVSGTRRTRRRASRRVDCRGAAKAQERLKWSRLTAAARHT
jgi:hypothetical protein